MLFASLAALIVLKLASPAVAFPAPQGEGISLKYTVATGEGEGISLKFAESFTTCSRSDITIDGGAPPYDVRILYQPGGQSSRSGQSVGGLLIYHDPSLNDQTFTWHVNATGGSAHIEVSSPEKILAVTPDAPIVDGTDFSCLCPDCVNPYGR